MSVDRVELMARHEQRLRLMVPAPLDDLLPLSLFQGLPEKVRPKVLDKARRNLHFVDYRDGELVLRAGAYSDTAYFVVKGEVEVLVPESERRLGPAEGHEPVLMGPGELLGELSALTRFPASADVRARGPVTLLHVKVPGLRMLLAASKELKKFLDERYRKRALKALFGQAPIFAGLPDDALEALKEKAELVSFEPGAVIEEEGAPASHLYVVRGGYVKVSVRAGTADLAVTYLRTGDCAGEGAVLEDAAWPFRLQALEHVEAVKLKLEDVRAAAPGASAFEDALWRGAIERLKARGAVLDDPLAAEHVQMAMDTGLIHGESVLLVDLAACTSCDECVRGCASTHGGVPRFLREGTTYRHWLIATACYQCTDPVCMIDCPTGAISRQMGTLEVTINALDHPTRPCIGCGNCAKRCPWGNIVMHEPGTLRPDGKPVEFATKCDLCVGRAEGPACVQMCPHGCATRVSFKDLGRVAALLG